jgi:hypothetical protein
MKQPLLYIALTLFTSCTENNTSNQINATNNPDSLTGKNTYVNPVDGNTYYTNGEFKDYTPEGDIKPASGPIQLSNVVLLTEQNKIPDIIPVEKLANFIKGVDTVVIKELTGVKESGQIILQFTLYSDKKTMVQLSYNGDFKTKNLEGVSEKVKQFSLNTRTYKDSCIFQSLYSVNQEQK